MASSRRTVLSVDLMKSFKDAVRQKDETRINELITSENAQGQDEAGDTFLHIVAKEGTVETAIRLLELGADVNAFNFQLRCPIFYAMENSARMVEILLKNYEREFDSLVCRSLLYASEEETVRVIVNKNLSKFLGKTSQDTILSSGNSGEIQTTEDLMRALLNSEYCKKCNENKYTYLIVFAARIERRDILKLIINHGKGNLNIRDTTALHYAVSLQCSAAVRWLLDEGADPNCKTGDQGITPLHIAAFLENQEICELLLEAKPNLVNIKNPLFYVCGTNEIGDSFWGFMNKVCHDNDSFFFKKKVTFNTEIMRLLLESGVDPNLKLDDDGEKPIHYACRARRLTDVKILLKFGADINAFDAEGMAVIQIAVRDNNILMTDLLIKNGANINMQDSRRYTLLMNAMVQNAYGKMTEYLLDQGAKINPIFDGGQLTFFHEALCNNLSNIVEHLLELNINLKMGEYNCFLYGRISEQATQIFISYLALKEIKSR